MRNTDSFFFFNLFKNINYSYSEYYKSDFHNKAF